MIFLFFLGESILFFFTMYVCFYLPGRITLTKLTKKLSFLEETVFSLCTGISVFLLFAYIFSSLHLFYLGYLLLLAAFIYAAKKAYLFPTNFLLPNTLRSFLFLTMLVLFSVPMITSGMFGDTLYLRGVNSNDGLWHLSLIHELQHQFPPDIPGYAGVRLTGYHFFYNLLLAHISNLTHLNDFFLLFQAFPLLTAFLLGGNIYIFLFSLTKQKNISLLGVLLAYFGGNFALFMPFLHLSPINLTTGFAVDQPASMLMNPPFALSLVFIIFSLNCLFQYENSKHPIWLMVAGITSGITTMTKVYAGILLLAGWSVYTIVYLFKKNIFPFFVFLGVILLTASTYLPFFDPTNHLIFSPLWVLEKMYKENMPWYEYAEKISTYSRLGVLKGLLITYGQGILTFIFGNLGTRILGLLLLPLLFFSKRKSAFSFSLSTFFTTITSVSILLPTFFLQSGQVYEMIQFYWYSLFLLALLSCYGLSSITKTLDKYMFIPRLKTAPLGLFLLLTLPSALFFLLPFFSPPTKYDTEILQAQLFLSRTGSYTDTMIELPPKDIINLQAWYSYTQPVFSSIADHRSYLSFVNHTFPGTNVAERLKKLHTIQVFMKDGKKQNEVAALLKMNQIKYIVSPERNNNLKKVLKQELFHNQEVTIYQQN